MRWLSTALFHSPIPLALCTSQAGFEKLMRRMRVKQSPSFLGPGAAASTHVFVNEKKNGEQSIVVCVRRLPRDALQEVLVHEAIHVWQEIRECIGEERPSREFEAYAVQNITASLLCEYARQTKRKKK